MEVNICNYLRFFTHSELVMLWHICTPKARYQESNRNYSYCDFYESPSKKQSYQSRDFYRTKPTQSFKEQNEMPFAKISEVSQRFQTPCKEFI